MIVQPFTHVGIVVPDLSEAMDEFGAAMGLQWCDVIEWDLDVWTPQGVATVTSRFTYSAGSAPRHELLQSFPGTLWEAGAPTGHHVGFWSTDLRGDGANLVARGHELVGTLNGEEPGQPTGFAYYRHPAIGTLLELVDAALIPRFERWWAGDRF